MSLVLFNLYVDDLSKHLRVRNTGCMIGETRLNHLMYADDLVTFSPSSAGLQQLLDTQHALFMVCNMIENTMPAKVPF